MRTENTTANIPDAFAHAENIANDTEFVKKASRALTEDHVVMLTAKLEEIRGFTVERAAKAFFAFIDGKLATLYGQRQILDEGARVVEAAVVVAFVREYSLAPTKFQRT